MNRSSFRSIVNATMQFGQHVSSIAKTIAKPRQPMLPTTVVARIEVNRREFDVDL
jgi:hypothetical protein